MCRFDLDDPEGTCYLATDELVAVIETIGSDAAIGVVTPEFLDARTSTRGHSPFRRERPIFSRGASSASG
ncbi:MAG: hypothetical protein ACYDEY_09500 [Acidimicrobiales bacterium]